MRSIIIIIDIIIVIIFTQGIYNYIPMFLGYTA
jgi:hypothetical protein